MKVPEWKLPADIYDAMVARCEAEYPEESCGLVLGEAGADPHALEVVPMENIQNRMHERDPERFPRDARTAYYLDPLQLHRTTEAMEERGLAMRAIYHSHPDHDAYFSKKDREDAAPPDLGEPLFPDCAYIVFSVREGRTVDVKGYVWVESQKDFEEISICREAGAASRPRDRPPSALP